MEKKDSGRENGTREDRFRGQNAREENSRGKNIQSAIEAKPLTDLKPEDVENVRFVLADIDDTLTKEGKLLSQAYNALWRLSEAGFEIIPVTGRPAGWCDMIIRQWPVSAVVGENGAFVYYNEKSSEDASGGKENAGKASENTDPGPYKTFVHPSIEDNDRAGRLLEVEKEVFRRVPEVRRAKDQQFRIYDLAIDFAEDRPRYGLDIAEKVATVCREMGAHAKISSIHVNTWFGEYDKLDTVLRFFREERGIEREEAEKKVLYCGDSPNDAPMFSFFPLSCGVANVKKYLSLIEPPPAYVTGALYGYGFAEAAEYLLEVTGRKYST